MKKKIISQLMILSFAFAGLFLVGNNVFSQQGDFDYLPPHGSTCNSSIRCNQGFGDEGQVGGGLQCCKTSNYRGNARD